MSPGELTEGVSEAQFLVMWTATAVDDGFGSRSEGADGV